MLRYQFLGYGLLIRGIYYKQEYRYFICWHFVQSIFQVIEKNIFFPGKRGMIQLKSNVYSSSISSLHIGHILLSGYYAPKGDSTPLKLS